MKKERRSNTRRDNMLKEYDFSNSRPNPYAKRYATGTNVVLLDKDLAELFPDSASVNRALRALRDMASLVRNGRRKTRSQRKSAA